MKTLCEIGKKQINRKKSLCPLSYKGLSAGIYIAFNFALPDVCFFFFQICFTRCLYAQLSQQPFKPYKESEWPLPAPSHTEFQAHELGHKLVRI